MSDNMTREQMEQTFYLKTKSPAYQSALNDCRRVADSMANILIIGSSGTGKDVAARYIHACSSRQDQPFVAVNCSSFTETLLESELFGHEQGAFTGAVRSRTGKFEQANHGSLFIDEVGDLSMNIQLKLLRAIETRVIERIGSNVPRKLDFRLIAATNKPLAPEIAAGRFREDFFYRISTIVIRLPNLQERREDLPDLINFFLQASQKNNRRQIRRIEPEVRDFLMNYHYPGNIRELSNIIDRMVVLSENGVITRQGLPILYNMDREGTPQQAKTEFQELLPWKEFKRQSEREYLQWVLAKTGGNASEAARRLELSYRQLCNKILEYNLRTAKPDPEEKRRA